MFYILGAQWLRSVEKHLNRILCHGSQFEHISQPSETTELYINFAGQRWKLYPFVKTICMV